MLLIQCVTAYTALTALSKQEMPHKAALAMVLAKKRLAPHVEFYVEKERELVETFAKRDEKGDVIKTGENSFALDTNKDIGEYSRRSRELASTEIPEPIEPIKAPFPDKISPAHIEALEGIIEFEGGDT